MTRRLSQSFVLLALTCSLATTAVAQRKELAGLPQDAEAITQMLPNDPDPFEQIKLPGKGRVRAVACGKANLWLVRDELIVMTAKRRKVQKRLPVPEGLLALTADDRFLYVLEKGAVVVMDPVAVKEVRRIKLPEYGDAPSAIAVHGDELFVTGARQMAVINKRTGESRKSRAPSRSVCWLASDGSQLWGGALHGFGRVDPKKPGMLQVPRGLPHQYQRGLATFVEGRLLVIKNRDRDGKRVTAGLVTVKRTLPREYLTISLHRGQTGVRYEVGPKPIASADKVVQELERIHADPSSKVPGPGGKPALMPLMIVVYPDVTVAELGVAWDLVNAAGWSDVYCISSQARARPAEPPAPPPPPVRVKRR